MKKYIAVKNITILVSMFLAGFLVMANGAIAGKSSSSGLFVDELANKGIVEDPKLHSDFGVGDTTIFPLKKKSSVFVDELANKGISETSTHQSALGGSDRGVIRDTPVIPTTRDSNSNLFIDELANKGISPDSQ